MWAFYFFKAARSTIRCTCQKVKSSFLFSQLLLEGQPDGFSTCARPTRGIRDRALREHGESPGFPSFSFPSLPLPPIEGGGQMGPQLRALRDHCFIVGPQRARRTLCLSPLPLLHLLLHPPYNNFF